MSANVVQRWRSDTAESARGGVEAREARRSDHRSRSNESRAIPNEEDEEYVPVFECSDPSIQRFLDRVQQRDRDEVEMGEEVDALASAPHTAADVDHLIAKVVHLAQAVRKYDKCVESRRRRILELKRRDEEQQVTIASLRAGQKQLFDKFCVLRQKYDGVKTHLCEVLWTVIPSGHIPGVEGKGPGQLEAIPPLDHDIVESGTQIGTYGLADVLGEGQFASVRALTTSRSRPRTDDEAHHSDWNEPVRQCWTHSGTGADYSEKAAKVISKADVVSLTTLRRVDNEIAVLRLLKHEGVMKLYEVIHAPACLYMVTDRAGRDLFEYFDEHLEGVSEDAACLILHKIMEPLQYCHSKGVVHRDLKPENVLFADRKPLTEETRVVLCDFGLCARIGSTGMLQDENTGQEGALREFCGSPGFFAPEMLVDGLYDGKKADVWSLGCILLELVIGHEEFCRLWMSAYDNEHLKDSAIFQASVMRSVERLKKELPLRLSPELCSFLHDALNLQGHRRPSLSALLQHEWIKRHGRVDIAEGSKGTFMNEQDVAALEQLAPGLDEVTRQTRGHDLSILVADDTSDGDLAEPEDTQGAHDLADILRYPSHGPDLGSSGSGYEAAERRMLDTEHCTKEFASDAERTSLRSSAADEPQRLLDTYQRSMPARERVMKRPPDTPTILGAQKGMMPPTEPSLKGALSSEDHGNSELLDNRCLAEPWMPGSSSDSPRVSSPAFPRSFFGVSTLGRVAEDADERAENGTIRGGSNPDESAEGKLGEESCGGILMRAVFDGEDSSSSVQEPKPDSLDHALLQAPPPPGASKGEGDLASPP